MRGKTLDLSASNKVICTCQWMSDCMHLDHFFFFDCNPMKHCGSISQLLRALHNGSVLF